MDPTARDNSLGRDGKWHIYSSLPGWQTSRGAEIWLDDFIVPAKDGRNVLELNAHPGSGDAPFSIFQTFDTSIGTTYEVSFWSRARRDNAEEFAVLWDGFGHAIDSHQTGVWTNFIYQFVAENVLAELRFTSLDAAGDTTGNLLDLVSVTRVPEPGTLALLALGLVGLVLTRRRTTHR